jgi:hypothetical protein
MQVGRQLETCPIALTIYSDDPGKSSSAPFSTSSSNSSKTSLYFYVGFWVLLRIEETDLHVGDGACLYEMNLHLLGWQYPQ